MLTMGKISKTVALLLTLTIVMLCLTLLTVESVTAQTISKPSVPEFTIRFVDNSYDVPPRYDYDSYTGKDVLVESGYHVQNKTIELVINNRGFSSYYDTDGNRLSLYYLVQTKGHFGDSWWYINDGYYGPDNPFIGGVSELAEKVTELTFGLVGNNSTLRLHNLDISEGGEADFRVQAFLGYYFRTVTMTMLGESYQYNFIGQYSGWSPTQTIAIPETSTLTSPTPNPTPSPTVPELSWLVIVPLLLSVFSVALVVKHRKTRHG
jgi:hypothetical protein